MEKNDKWGMFKNYMHNELGITKEDIRTWIEDAVKAEAERLISNEIKSFDVKSIVKSVIDDTKYFGDFKLKSEITQELVTQLMKKIKIDK